MISNAIVPNSLIRAFTFVIKTVFMLSLAATSFANNDALNQNRVNQEQAIIAMSFAKAINDSNIDIINTVFSYDLFADRIIQAAKITDSSHSKKVKSSFLKTPEKLFSDILKKFKDSKTSIKFLGLSLIDNENRAVLRVNNSGKGYDYWELVFTEPNQDEIFIIDIYQLNKGELFSTSFGVLTKLLQQPDNQDIINYFKNVKLDKKTIKAFKAMIKYQKKSKFESAYQQLNALPDSIRNHRLIIKSGIKYAGSLSDDYYFAELERLNTHFPNETSSVFSLLDYFYMNKKYDDAIKSIELIENRYGDDGVTLLLKANILVMKGNHQAASDMAQKSIHKEETDDSPYWIIISSNIELKQHKEVINALDKLKKKFGYQFTKTDFITNPLYHDFAQSSEFNHWINK